FKANANTPFPSVAWAATVSPGPLSSDASPLVEGLFVVSTTKFALGSCDAGPVGFTGVTTGRYSAPQPLSRPSRPTAASHGAAAPARLSTRFYLMYDRFFVILLWDCKSGSRSGRGWSALRRNTVAC